LLAIKPIFLLHPTDHYLGFIERVLEKGECKMKNSIILEVLFNLNHEKV